MIMPEAWLEFKSAQLKLMKAAHTNFADQYFPLASEWTRMALIRLLQSPPNSTQVVISQKHHRKKHSLDTQGWDNLDTLSNSANFHGVAR